jgi:NitT/TauT family transport system substrate-binding protein
MTFTRRRHLRAAGSIALLFAIALHAKSANAETPVLRVAQQFGIAYLPITVVKERGLFEKHAKQLGLTDTKIEWHRLSGASAMNDALISNSLDFASAGIAPMIVTWDKTRGSVNVIGIAALGSMPNVLTTNNPSIKTIADFNDGDKIALPSVKVGFQPIVLQMAADKLFGKYDKLDHLTVSLPHPDAAAALLSGVSGITAHFTSPPFVQQELADSKIHAVLSSYDVVGGPHTFNVIYASKKFVDANPTTVTAFVDALDEANAWIIAHPEEAARLYIAAEKSKLTPDFVTAIVKDKNIRFTTTPERSEVFADFEARVGIIKHKPKDWKELFQSGLYSRAGS